MAFGTASEIQPRFPSQSDPASQWTAARKGPAVFSYSDNDLRDTDHGFIMDVEATRSIPQAEVGSTKTMPDRVKTSFGLHPEHPIADTAYGTASMPGWLVAREIAKTHPYVISMYLRKKVEMLFAHLKRTLGLNRLRLRGPCCASEEFLLSPTAQNLRKLAKKRPAPQHPRNAMWE